MAVDPLETVAAAWGIEVGELRRLLEQHGARDRPGNAETLLRPPSVPPPPSAPVPPPRMPDRYRSDGLIGQGAMGEVHRVFDRHLARTVARKVIRPAAHAQPDLRARFLTEARITAQLQHPGIVPVYDHGVLPDGRAWFTMKEVRGKTLLDVILEAHAGGPPDEPTLHRLVQCFHRVCEAVAYAHGRGVVHRDLKPTNIMLGEHGEVLVLDWGIAKVSHAAVGTQGVVSDQLDAHATLAGAITGTPAYIAPEVAHGHARRVDARADVYSLGAVLYEILSGTPPYSGSTLTILQEVLAGPPRDLRTRDEPEVGPALATRLPPALVTACEQAMSRDAEARFADGSGLAEAVAAWLEGVEQNARARTVVAEAEALGARARANLEASRREAREAESALRALAPWAPEVEKAPWWDLSDRAAASRLEAVRLDAAAESRLRAALALAPRLPEAHAALARRWRGAHAAAEARREDSEREAGELRRHAVALPPEHPERADHLRWLEGHGTLDLDTDPPGAMARLYRYQPARRRLSPVLVGEVGPTPFAGLPIAHGSYLLEIRHPRSEPVRLPISVGRGEAWRSVAPGTTRPRPVRLPRRGTLDAGSRFIPAGWFLAGGDPLAVDPMPARRLWVDDWVVDATHVTNAQYIRFLDDLVARGWVDDALRYAPRERPGTPGEEGALIYRFSGGGFALRADADGDLWEPDAPVLMVDFAGAEAYAAWRAARTAQPWQLLPELVWEKAARGVDGRAYPWGDGFDPTFACMRQSHPGRAMPARAGTWPVDESPYGVRDMAGNAATWCADPWRYEGPPCPDDRVVAPPLGSDAALRVVRGGTWNDAPDFLRAARRNFNPTHYRGSLLSFRIGRPLS
jgi:serine/threonine protein kinase/formylglycine-generating enzyme required for sulfatase activity